MVVGDGSRIDLRSEDGSEPFGTGADVPDSQLWFERRYTEAGGCEVYRGYEPSESNADGSSVTRGALCLEGCWDAKPCDDSPEPKPCPEEL